MDQAVQLLVKHLQDPNASIAIIVDADFDGYSSAALLLNYIYARWPSSINKFTYMLHDSKTHGIELDKIQLSTSLVIVPDAGSNQYEVHKALSDLSIDVLILDHHQCDMISPYACVINN